MTMPPCRPSFPALAPCLARRLLAAASLCLACLLGTAPGAAAAPGADRALPPGMSVPAAAQPGPGFDVARATEAWLGLLSPEQQARSDAYFEGGYWLALWSLLYTVAVMALLLLTPASRRMRDLATRAARGRRGRLALFYAAQFIVLVALLQLPFSLYTGYVREHAYGLSNLSLGAWLREWAIGLGVSILIFAPVIALAYAAVRRARGHWWMWATGGTFVLALFLATIEPVFIAPLFNDYKPLPEGPVRTAVLRLARANAIPTEHLEWFDASRQTTRVSANVSGVGGVARINLNDNLLEKTSLPEIKAVLGHEMGHYVMHHGFQLSVYLALLAGIAFAVVNVLMNRLLAPGGPGERLGLRDRADPAGLPAVVAFFAIVWFLLTPLVNTTIRTIEAEADAFGLNAAREPQGFAMVAMRLSTYRKLRPGPLEEFVFFDHPSGYARVHRAMTWQQENLP